jgi:type IV secretion system protein TrbI
MSEEHPAPAPNAAPNELHLHSERPKVTRLSRKMLIALSTVVTIVIVGASLWALRSSHKPPPQQVSSASTRNVAAALNNLPRDYTGVPRSTPALGPPLPGDLGRPILNAQGALGQNQTSPEEQRKAQAIETARTSQLFVANASSHMNQVVALANVPAAPAVAPSEAKPSTDPTATQNMQDRKEAFANAPADKRTASTDQLTAPPSPYVVQAGSVIPAALVTGIRSDLPGQITAQVTANVYDSPTGNILLIPQGSKLIGQYDSNIAFAQTRVQLVWNRIILPNGQSIVLERQPGADTQGYSGLEDEVDNHWGQLFEAAMLSTLLSVGAEAGTSDSENNLAQAIRQGASQSFNQVGEQVVGRELNVQPTLTIRPGFPVRVIVNRDLVLTPYQG